MDKKEVKIEKHLAAGEAAGFLHSLAEALTEKPAKNIYYDGVQLQGLKKVKMHLKKDGDLFSLKLKFKYSAPSDEKKSGLTKKPAEYKTLKKEINKSFKSLKASIDKGSMPAAQTVDTFIQQAEHMVTFKNLGYGDEYFEDFIRLCHEFKKTYQTGNIESLVRAYNNIDARKALCHDKYD